MHEAPPPSGVPALLANHRPPHPAETRSPPRARQLCHPQACHPQACQGDGMARQAPALSPALHPDLGIVAQPSRALLRLDHSSPHPARCLHLGARTRSGHPRLPRPSQCPPQALRLDKIGRGNPCQSQPRASHPGNRRERESSDKLSTLPVSETAPKKCRRGRLLDCQRFAMPERQTAPCGSWSSPITSDLIVASTIGLGGILLDGADVYWLESRPQENGRSVIVRRAADGSTVD